MNVSKTLNEDFESIISDTSIMWERLRKCSVLVTGATGTIGKIIVGTLGMLNYTKGQNVKIYALGRNHEKGQMLSAYSGVEFISADIRNKLDISQPIDYIIHCAAVTESAKMVSLPVDVIETELQGGRNILELARINNVKGMIYVSSMEAYGLLNSDNVKETDLGYIDLSNPRSCYPQSKRMLETMCNAYYCQYGVRVNIVRLGATFGAGADFENDKRVWAQFARSAKNGEDIVLHTEGKSLSSFVYMADAVRALFLVLLSDINGEIFNVAATTLSIRQLAERVAKQFNLTVNINPPKDIAKLGYPNDFKLVLNCDKLKSAGWKPQVSQIEQMFERLLAIELIK